jgi:hypothetical protein
LTACHFATIVLEDEMLTTLEIVGVFRFEPSESSLNGAEYTACVNRNEKTAANMSFLSVSIRKRL